MDNMFTSDVASSLILALGGVALLPSNSVFGGKLPLYFQFFNVIKIVYSRHLKRNENIYVFCQVITTIKCLFRRYRYVAYKQLVRQYWT